ncbi:glycosyltransferase family 4 protein [Cytobacillus praedii]|uniref:glycosyltransferase family 4 protein n=1 Tax=Cytobacillus praedii TaxID=1742358 RepID=UPI0007106B71|nr:glycosyltransferase family 4 protein [Cytobacillus praedii]
MKDILIVAHFTQTPGEKGNGRFHYIANLLALEGHKIEIVTTNFSHDCKKHREFQQGLFEQVDYKIAMLEEPGYKKNVSLKRIYSHYTFGKNLKKYLATRVKPDVIYCAVPSIDAAYMAAEYAKRNGVNFIIDVQDIWPEAFKMVLKLPLISDLLFFSMMKKANYVYRTANKVIAVSDTYVNRAMDVNSKCQKGMSVFLGTELTYFDHLANKCRNVVKPMNEVWLAYIGTLGHSYDLTSIMDALQLLNEKGYSNFKFIIMGEGPLKQRFIQYARDKKIPCEFTGMLDYSEMVSKLIQCDIAVNPIAKGAAGSIINKVGDYAAAGLPVINTQECQEYRDLITNYSAGINCENGNPEDIAEKILFLFQNENNRREMGRNNRVLAEEKFDRGKTYPTLIAAILGE